MSSLTVSWPVRASSAKQCMGGSDGEKVLILVGTKKGAFILESDAEAPILDAARPVLRHMADSPCHRRSGHGHDFGGGGNEWFGPAVWKSTDLGATWTHSSEGLAYGEGKDPIKAVWSLAPSNGRLYAGVEPAGLFLSDDDGARWQHVGGLRDHPTRPQWQPGGIGLVLHSLVPHPTDDRQLWVGISSVGVFHTADGGESWTTRNQGTRCDYLPEEQRYPEYGPVRALPCASARHAGPALPAEPLRHVSQRRWREELGQHRGRAALQLRLPRRHPSARPRNALSPAAQWRHQGPLCAGRQGRRLAHP